MSMITDQAALQALQVIITKAKELAPIPIPSTLELQQDIGHEESADLQENTAEEDNENRVEQRQVQRRRRRVRNKISKVGSRQSTENIFSYKILVVHIFYYKKVKFINTKLPFGVFIFKQTLDIPLSH